MNRKKRQVEVVVISDVHLGTYGSRALELSHYLKSIKPKTLVLNGDIVDMWQFSKRYWPKTHMKVLKQVLGMAAKGTRVVYIPGNHDETLRKFSGTQIGEFEITNNLILELDGKKAWFFHGDVFDVVMQNSKWLAKLGAIGYDALILLNVVVDYFGRKKFSLSKKIKDNVKSAVKYINNFEETAGHVAISKGYDYVICGHIHNTSNRIISDQKDNLVHYLNSGDWIENLSALEYENGEWKIFRFREDFLLEYEDDDIDEHALQITGMNNKDIFKQLLHSFQEE